METVTMETTTWGDCIVADPAICHSEPTFRGTHILVADVLEQVAGGSEFARLVTKSADRG